MIASKTRQLLLAQLAAVLLLEFAAAEVAPVGESRLLPLEPQRTVLASANDPSIAENKDEREAFARWEKNPMFQPTFESKYIAMPAAQRDYLRNAAEEDFKLYTQIVDEAIEMRNKMAPSTRLIAKYGLRVLSGLIRRRNDEMKIKPRIVASPKFFDMIVKLFEDVLAKSKELKRGLKKDQIDVVQLRRRIVDIFDYIKHYLAVSPIGMYVRLNETRLYMDSATMERKGVLLPDESSELLAQFRTIGYESAMSWAKRLINLFRTFAKGGQLASPDDVPE